MARGRCAYVTLRKTGWAQRSHLLRIRVETHILGRNLGLLSSTALGQDRSLGGPVVPALSECLLQLASQKPHLPPCLCMCHSPYLGSLSSVPPHSHPHLANSYPILQPAMPLQEVCPDPRLDHMPPVSFLQHSVGAWIKRASFLRLWVPATGPTCAHCPALGTLSLHVCQLDRWRKGGRKGTREGGRTHFPKGLWSQSLLHGI